MRAIWKGAVSFGLVNVPVRLYSATENHDIQFRQVHREDGGRIRYKRFCSIDGQEVSYDDIAKGYETEDGDMVVLGDEDFADLPSRSSKEISVEKFVPADQIDPIYLDKSYYLEPDASATKPYTLLREALESENRMAIVTVSIRTRMTMAVLRVRDGVLVMQTMLWPDEVRSPDFARLGEAEDATSKELAMAHLLIDQLAGDFDPAEFEDDYALALEPGRQGQDRGRRGGRSAACGAGERRGRRPARRPGQVGREGEGRPRGGAGARDPGARDPGEAHQTGRQEEGRLRRPAVAGSRGPGDPPRCRPRGIPSRTCPRVTRCSGSPATSTRRSQGRRRR